MKPISNKAEYGCFYFYGRDHTIYETCLLETNGCCAYRDIGIGSKETCYYWKVIDRNEE
ncbi:MAG: hypothetical protein WC055_01080 [Melioribacteraceae bacterium]